MTIRNIQLNIEAVDRGRDVDHKYLKSSSAEENIVKKIEDVFLSAACSIKNVSLFFASRQAIKIIKACKELHLISEQKACKLKASQEERLIESLAVPEGYVKIVNIEMADVQEIDLQ